MPKQLGSSTGNNLFITIPSRGETHWDALIETLCFKKISEHNHHGGGLGAQISTEALEDSSVTTVKIADNAVTGDKIANNSITSAHISPDTILDIDLAPNSVGTSELKASSVTSTELASNSVTTSKIYPLAVSADKISTNVAGLGLSKNGTAAINVNVDGTTIEIDQFNNLRAVTAPYQLITNQTDIDNYDDTDTSSKIIYIEVSSGSFLTFTGKEIRNKIIFVKFINLGTGAGYDLSFDQCHLENVTINSNNVPIKLQSYSLSTSCHVRRCTFIVNSLTLTGNTFFYKNDIRATYCYAWTDNAIGAGYPSINDTNIDVNNFYVNGSYRMYMNNCLFNISNISVDIEEITISASSGTIASIGQCKFYPTSSSTTPYFYTGALTSPYFSTWLQSIQAIKLSEDHKVKFDFTSKFSLKQNLSTTWNPSTFYTLPINSSHLDYSSKIIYTGTLAVAGPFINDGSTSDLYFRDPNMYKIHIAIKFATQTTISSYVTIAIVNTINQNDILFQKTVPNQGYGTFEASISELLYFENFETKKYKVIVSTDQAAVLAAGTTLMIERANI